MGPSSVDGRPPALNAYLYCPFHIWILSSIIQVPTSKLMLRVANLSFGNCQESWPLNFWTLWTLLYRSMLFVFNSFAFPSELLIQFHSSSRIPALFGISSGPVLLLLFPVVTSFIFPPWDEIVISYWQGYSWVSPGLLWPILALTCKLFSPKGC